MKETGETRFARTEILLGREALASLARQRVAVFGLGGVGSYVVEALARAGIGHFLLVDHDTVCLTNTNRQLIAVEGNYGKPKIEVTAARVKAINPGAVVETRQVFAGPDNIPELLQGDFSYVADAVDTVAAKTAIICYCLERKIPVISAMGAGNKLDPLAFRVADIGETHTCRLARAVRLSLRRKGINGGVKVVFSTEKPRQPASPSPVPGTVSYVPAVAGLILAGEIIRDLLGLEKK
ncbi:MAG: tRNA threonylcarbamoyladenosine dehydratase [Clostridia bacterium]|nr:tRNA threonylcarbamoyladenosine dehydratase [Clostridia bacterium]